MLKINDHTHIDSYWKNFELCVDVLCNYPRKCKLNDNVFNQNLRSFVPFCAPMVNAYRDIVSFYSLFAETTGYHRFIRKNDLPFVKNKMLSTSARATTVGMKKINHTIALKDV